MSSPPAPRLEPPLVLLLLGLLAPPQLEPRMHSGKVPVPASRVPLEALHLRPVLLLQLRLLLLLLRR